MNASPRAALLKPLRQLLLGLAAACLPLLPWAASTDLATAPLETSTATLVKPNIMFVLDDSGSMGSGYLPDWAGNWGASSYPQLYRNPKFNGVYYDPSVTYTPPLTYSGSSYPSYTSWTAVPVDGFKVQSTSTVDLTTSTSVPSVYYTFVPGEYCTGANLRTCATQSAASTTYPYPAYLRWCTDSAMSNCQATYIDTAITTSSGSVTYTVPRYPGMSSTATITIGGSGSTTVTSVKVNGVQILSATATSAQTSRNKTTYSTSTLASNIATYINSCTSSTTGNCGVAGYSASASGSVVTITSPGGTNAYGYSPVVTVSGSMTATATAFSGGTPGSWIKTTISSSTTSYPYPGTSAVASTRTDCASSSGCSYSEEMTNFANWYAYYHTRMQMMKTAASLALIDLSTSYRLGYMSINNNTGSDFLDIADITTTSGGQKSQFYAKLFAAKPNSSTPLRKALYTVGRYYAGKYSNSTINSVSTTDPMQYACQRNYTMLSTDGYWNESTTPYRIDGSTPIGDQDGSSSGVARPYLDGNSVSNTLADVAQYYYATDIRSAAFGNATSGSTGADVADNSYANGQQRMYTHTLGLGASGYMQFNSAYASASSGDYYDVANGTTTSTTTQAAGVCAWQSSGSCTWPKPVNNTQTAIDDLWHAAVNGRGDYYSATNPSELKTALTNFVNAVSASTSNSAAATASSLNLSTTADNYVFATSFCSAKWFGELARYQIDATTGTLTTTPDWSQSGASNDCASSSTTTTTTPLLDNTTWSSRNIYTYNPSTGNRIAFTYDTLNSTQQAYFKVAAIGGLSQMCSSGSSCVSSSLQIDSTTAGTTTGIGGVNLVNYLRGDRSNEGTSSTTYYFVRTHVLGDIVNSQSVYVGPPNRSYTDTGYSTYKTNQSSRTAMVYAGANDGMLHAFAASNGAESWAYIPSMLLPNLYKLADKKYAANHVNFVDGHTIQADVYYDSAWHTILVGGLGQGGRGYYALDVTTPTSPTVLWEFTYNTSAGTGYVKDEDLGYSYGPPIVTKLSDGTWAVIVASGYNNVSPGTGHGIIWILNAQTGAIISKIDNGMGSSSTVTGCSAAPCPSGLAQLSAWVTSSSNNTATYVYGGDLYGNVWRFNISALTASGGTATVQLLATLSDSSGTRQPVTTVPELGYASSQHMVYVGTGEYLGTADVSTTQVQSIYALKDPLTGSSTSTALYANPRSTLCTTTSLSSCFVKQTLSDSSGVRTVADNDITVDLSTMNGWFADLPESGERINTDPNLSSGILIFTSNIPTTTSACATGGYSYLNYLDYKTGSTPSGATNVGTLLSSTALAGGSTVVKLSDGTLAVITSLSDGSTKETTLPTSSSGGTRRLWWRELFEGL